MTRNRRVLVILHLILSAELFSSSYAYDDESTSDPPKEVRCGSIDIRNRPEVAYVDKADNGSSDKFKACTVMEGDFSLTMITQVNVTQENFTVFPNLIEITGYLLVYQVRGLQSLGKIFPKLRVIGGQSLILNYALIVYQNEHLKEIGLTELTTIRNGGVRIMDNSRLCFTKYIDWRALTAGEDDDILTDSPSTHEHCIVDTQCHRGEERRGTIDRCIGRSEGRQIACWNEEYCQKHCAYTKAGNGTGGGAGAASHRVGPGCNENGEKCHAQCVGGCWRLNDPSACYSCQKIKHNGVCLEQCPVGLFKHHNRRCVTADECRATPMVYKESGEMLPYKAVAGVCHYECPKGMQTDRNNSSSCVKCDGHCPKECKGMPVDSLSLAIKEFKGCNIVDGNLVIELRVGMEKNVAEKLSEAFGDIREITGYLVVRFCPSLVSLYMFKSLRIIRGNNLYRERYAIVVVENPNLRNIFDPRKLANFSIGNPNAVVQFQNNRMLCYNKVTDLIDHLGIRENISEELDVSPYSNGEKATCVERTFEVKIGEVMNFGFVLAWTAFNTTGMDHRKFLGYQIFYKVVDEPDPDLDIDDDRSACADPWRNVFEPEEEEITSSGGVDNVDSRSVGSNSTTDASTGKGGNNGTVASGVRGTVIAADHIRPATWYAFYVQTRVVNHPGAENAKSKIQFVFTNYGEPTAPLIVESEVKSLTPDSISLVWRPPQVPNGDVTSYIVNWEHIEYDFSDIQGSDACAVQPSAVGGERGSKSPAADEYHQFDPPQSSNDTASGFISTIAPNFAARAADADTCQQRGCCSCEEVDSLRRQFDPEYEERLEGQLSERDQFENAVQNNVFVQNCKLKPNGKHCDHGGKKQQLQLQRGNSGDEEQKKSSNIDKKSEVLGTVGRRRKREIGTSAAPKPTTLMIPTKTSVTNDQQPINTINVTALNVVIGNLLHYSDYKFRINACQNSTNYPYAFVDGEYLFLDEKTNPPAHHCSARQAHITFRTLPIPDKDRVDPATVKVINGSDATNKTVFWKHPNDTNGQILGYRVTCQNMEQAGTPHTMCASKKEFDSRMGIEFTGLSDGWYSVKIETVSLAVYYRHSKGNGSILLIDRLFEVRAPRFFTTPVIIAFCASFLVLFAAVALVMYYCINRHFGKKVREYVGQVISANPDYLSQLEIYHKDDWELERDTIVLTEEIGSGSFGKVFRGLGKDVLSKCGVQFGECAVKTVPENVGPSERLHFLIEASEMKKFNTTFIVKLYGVVSEGQPVLIVMEMMEKGNLRDYLRSRRPDAEENVFGLAPPTNSDRLKWAIQAADGMAYLEHIGYCHRDLAARNLMVSKDDDVKIGDFGMARDIYYHEYYKPAGKRMMPIRWMAPESLRDGKFSKKSDVWSYGVVLWEMVTLAQQPYAGVPNEDLLEYISVQRRIMPKPVCQETDPDMLVEAERALKFWYDLMIACWEYDPRSRPTFADLVETLLPYYNDENFRNTSWYLNNTSRRGTAERQFRRSTHGQQSMTGGSSTLNTSLNNAGTDGDNSSTNRLLSADPDDSDTPLNPEGLDLDSDCIPMRQVCSKNITGRVPVAGNDDESDDDELTTPILPERLNRRGNGSASGSRRSPPIALVDDDDDNRSSPLTGVRQSNSSNHIHHHQLPPPQAQQQQKQQQQQQQKQQQQPFAQNSSKNLHSSTAAAAAATTNNERFIKQPPALPV